MSMKDLKEAFVAVAVALISACAVGQTNTLYYWKNFVGKPGWSGTRDGTGSVARFSWPNGITVDGSGTVYVSDNCAIRKVTSLGVVTTLAGSAQGSGSSDGTGTAARFTWPRGLAVDSIGNIYVADAGNSTIRKIAAGGVVTTFAGVAGSSGTNDGVGSEARFASPEGVVVDSTGTLYVADTANHAIRQVTGDGMVTTLAGWPGISGTNDGVAGAARFNNPSAVTLDGAGNLYVAEYGNSTIRRVTSAGVVTTLAGTPGVGGSADGTGSAAQFGWPEGMAADNSGDLFVADTHNYTIRKVTGGGVVTTLAGSLAQAGSVDSTGSAARFNYPVSVAFDGTGTMYVGDMSNETIRKVTSVGVVTTLAGNVGVSGTNDGIGGAALFYWPSGVAVDSGGNLYVADMYNHTIRKVTSEGVVMTLAGLGGVSGSANGTGSAARFYWPFAVALDNSGNLIVADAGNDTIRKVTTNGVVTTLAGFARVPGTNNGTGSTARFNQPSGVAVDSAGNIFVGDYGNHAIRKVTSTGVVTTLAGRGGQPGEADGTGSAARFYLPNMVAVDSAGNVYVADTGNHTIRKVTSAGVVTTIGGAPGVAGGADGIGGAANFSSPYGVAVDSAGRVYVADSNNNRISIGTPLPVVAIALSGSSLTISWASAATGFSLQQNPDVSNANGWQPSSYSIADDGTVKSITIVSPTNSLFFRLAGN